MVQSGVVQVTIRLARANADRNWGDQTGRVRWWEPTIAAGAFGLLAGAAVFRRVRVFGESMSPTLLPGDRLLWVRLPTGWPLHRGDVVTLEDPRPGGATRAPGRRGTGKLLVKRVTATGPGLVVVHGDNPPASTDSRDFGPVPRDSVRGLVVYRYAPAKRVGPLPPVAVRSTSSANA